LAREGFVVVAPFHPGSKNPGEAREDRPRQIHKALNAMLADPRFATHADPNRLGMMGFSYGGAVALMSPARFPIWLTLAAYCRDRTDDPKACDGVPTDGSLANVVGKRSPDALAMKALVLMEPWGALFDRNGLTSSTCRRCSIARKAAISRLRATSRARGGIAPIRRGKRRCRAAISYLSIHALPHWRLRRPRPARMLPASIVPRSIGGSRSKLATFCAGIFDGENLT
jgi:hypothetical protein